MLKFPIFRCHYAALWMALLLAFSSLFQNASAQDYRLGARDVLSVTVLRHPELSAERIEVDPGGRIRLPFVGSIVAAGKTTSEITAIVRRGLLNQLNDPTVTVTIIQTRPQQIAVSGAVKSPGLFEIGSNWRISEAIAAAGGLNSSPETATATFSRQGGAAVTINLANVLRNSGSSENRRLRAGDTLRIIENTVSIRVAGQVVAPGAIEAPRGASIGDAIALAGGFGVGASRAVTVTRKNGSSGVINLGPGNTSKVSVQPGDLIVVSQSNDRVTVLGAVIKAGNIPLDVANPLQLSQALAEAGGLAAGAAGSRATLTRAGGESVPIDLYALTVLGDKTQDVRLKAGDVITIPQASGVTVFGAVLKPGTYTLEQSRAPRVTDAIIAAGGLSVPSAQAFIRIERAPQNVENSTDNAPAVAAPRELSIPRVNAATAPFTPGAGSITPRNSSAGANTSRASSANAVTAPLTLDDLLRANATRNGTAQTGASSAMDGGPIAMGAPGRNGANATDLNLLNARVYDGDRITVEAIAAVRVTVSGEVKTEGAFEVAPGTNLVDVLARAGGETPQASLENVTIRHDDGSSETVNVRAAAVLGAASQPIVLRNGDYIVVPRSQNLIYVVGGVKISDYYAVPPSGFLTLGESLSLAGGPVAGAQLNKIQIVRAASQGAENVRVDLTSNKGAVPAARTQVRVGDVVFVPEANNRPSTLQNILGAIGAFGAFGAFVR